MRKQIDFLAESAIQFAACLIRWLPEPAIRTIAVILGTIWFRLLRIRRRVILKNLALAFPEKSPAERVNLGQVVCVHLVRTLLEFLRIPRYARLGFERMVRIEGIEHFESAKSLRKGVLVVSGHLGSFELGLAMLALRFGDFSVVVKRLPDILDRFISTARTNVGLQLIPARGGIKLIHKALNSNGAVLMVLDQNATRRKGVFVDFFGRPACTMVSLAALAVRTGTPVIGVSTWREQAGVHVIRFHARFTSAQKGSLDETIRHLTQQYTSFLEQAIRAHPEQWFWPHKRWRTQPDTVGLVWASRPKE